jgi:hypothetical protein
MRLSPPTTKGKGGPNIALVARKAIDNRLRYYGLLLALKSGADLVALKNGGTAVILQPVSGGDAIVEVVTTYVAHRTRPATAAQRAEALNGRSFKQTLDAALANGADASVIEEGLEALCAADERVRATYSLTFPLAAK